RRLRAQPLANVALGCPRAFCQFPRGLRTARRQAFVQAELVAHANQRGVKRCAEIDQRSPKKFVELVWIDCHEVLRQVENRPAERLLWILGRSPEEKQERSTTAVGAGIAAIDLLYVKLLGGQRGALRVPSSL